MEIVATRACIVCARSHCCHSRNAKHLQTNKIQFEKRQKKTYNEIFNVNIITIELRLTVTPRSTFDGAYGRSTVKFTQESGRSRRTSIKMGKTNFSWYEMATHTHTIAYYNIEMSCDRTIDTYRDSETHDVWRNKSVECAFFYVVFLFQSKLTFQGYCRVFN